MSRYCKVLIIDDEFIMRQGMKHMLDWEKEGFTIVGEASNGQEALELIDELEPDIILSDIVMPVLNGVDFSKLVQTKYPKVQIIIISGYDNFEYVKSTLLSGVVDYILKPTLNPKELLVTLNKAVARIPGFELNKTTQVSFSNTIERYLLGFDSKLDCTAFYSYFNNSCFRILGINTKAIFGNNKQTAKAIRNDFNEFFIMNNEFKTADLKLNNDIYCAVINYKISSYEKLKNGIELIVNKNINIQDNLFFVLSKEFNKIEDIKLVYENYFINGLSDYFYYKDVHFLVAEDISDQDRKIDKFNFNFYSNLLKGNEYKVALNMFREYLEKLILAKTEEYKLKNFAKNLLYNILVSIDNLDIDTDELRQKYFIKIDDSKNVNEFAEVIISIIDEIESFINDDEAGVESRVREILEYIKEHYNEHLELKEISTVFNFNYFYLSSYFNTHSKEGFNEYLNKIRVNKACELLCKSQASVSEVSSTVGYSDHSYFCRVFKKITGLTPSSYRRYERAKEAVYSARENQ